MAKSKVGVHGTDAETGRNGGVKACPITRAQFQTKAPAAVTLPATALVRKEFSTGTMGYFAQIDMTVEVDGVPVKMKGNAQLYIANSSDAK